MIEELCKTNCIKQGNFKLKSGEQSKYYFDLKNLISSPQLLKQVGDHLYKMLDDFDIICGVPYGALPIATYISVTYNKPMIYIRDKIKDYGTQQMIEGEFSANDRCVIIDDVITSGYSLQCSIDTLKDKVNIVDVAVVMNRQQNPSVSLPFKYLLCKTDVTRYFLQTIQKTKNSKLIYAVDLTDTNEILRKLDLVGSSIVACKLHLDIISNISEEFVYKLIELSIKHNFLIIEDRKFNDISYIVGLQYKKFQNWVDMVTVHSLVTPDVIKCLSGALIVANMSNNNYDFESDAVNLVKECQKNVMGFITQKRIWYNKLICMTPGICIEEHNCMDQRYRTIKDVDTDFYIVGRAISNCHEDDLQKVLDTFQKD